MIHYSILNPSPSSQYFSVVAAFPVQSATTRICLPSWRPGRYELANYAQNLRGMRFEVNGTPIAYNKVARDIWELDTSEYLDCELTAYYDYYANQLDAGASYLSESQLYINPVNALVYEAEQIMQPCTVTLDTSAYPEAIVAGIPLEEWDWNGTTLHFPNYHELADSPFVVTSPSNFQQECVEVLGTYFYLHVIGESELDWAKVANEFKPFIERQVRLFGDFPVKEYYFLFQILPIRFYHGVEHLRSTVIALGPGMTLSDSDIYRDLLGISSHELFHVWNVKAIRPVEMMPYRYQEENYSPLGYVAEGVTTYYGDLMLLRSGNYALEEFLEEACTQLSKHFQSDGHKYQNLIDSSLESWLDGYKPGAPDRKISFYTKGMLVAWMLDVTIRKKTENTKSLDNVMRLLYQNFGKLGKGYSEEDYWYICEEVYGASLSTFYNAYILGTVPIRPYLDECFDYLGFVLDDGEFLTPSEEKLGIKVETSPDGRHRIMQIAQDGPARKAGLMINDQIATINEIQIGSKDLQRYLRTLIDYGHGTTIAMQVFREGKVIAKEIELAHQRPFDVPRVFSLPKLDTQQKLNRNQWMQGHPRP